MRVRETFRGKLSGHVSSSWLDYRRERGKEVSYLAVCRIHKVVATILPTSSGTYSEIAFTASVAR